MALLFSQSDIQARMSNQAFSRLYARNGGMSIDTAFVTTIIGEADSIVRMMTKAAFPAGFDVAGGTVDAAVIGACVDICNEIAASRHPAATEMSGYFLAGKRAKDFLQRLTRDENARVVTSGAGLPQPEAVIDNVLQSDGVTYNQPWKRIASGEDSSNF